MVESENSYIGWDFSLMQGKISMVFLFEPFFSLCNLNYLFAFLAWFCSPLQNLFDN